MSWLATDKDGTTYFYKYKPCRRTSDFGYDGSFADPSGEVKHIRFSNTDGKPINDWFLDTFGLSRKNFPKWEDEPIEIKINNNFILLS